MKKEGIRAVPEIMVPLTGIVQFKAQKEIIEATQSVFAETTTRSTQDRNDDDLASHGSGAEEADFFSFGTNDAQMTFGYSRDIAKFLPMYIDKGILNKTRLPYWIRTVLGSWSAWPCIRDGRSFLKCGICGEHGGKPLPLSSAIQPDSIMFRSPFRVPIARLAAARAAIEG